MIAIVTGASSGMGKEFVKILDKNEQLDEIWVIARSQARLDALKDEISTPIKVISLDLTKTESLEKYSELLNSEKPEIKFLINCSGYGKFGCAESIPIPEAMGMIDLNCKALVAITQASLPYLKKGSHIVELCSLSAFQPVPYINVYAASKAFVLSYSRGLYQEIKGRGISVTAVCPGWVRTAFFDRANQTDNKAITYFFKMYEAADVIKKAYRDAVKGKQVSVYGFLTRGLIFIESFIPHNLKMNIWLKQQGH